MIAGKPRIVAGATVLAAAVITVSAAVLTWDYAAARLRAPADDRRLEALQEQVRNDATLAPKLEADQKRIADIKRGRRIRINFLANALLVATAAFIAGAKWLLAHGAPPKPVVRPAGTARRTVASVPRLAPAPVAPPDLDLTAVDAIIVREGRSQEAAIPILQAIQAHYRYLPDEALRRVCELTEITPAQIVGTSSFYSRFRRSAVGEHIVRVCHGTACHVAGARQITDELRRGLALPEGADTDLSRTFTIEEVACLGCCSLAPVLMVDEHTAGRLTPATACDALATSRPVKPV